MYDKNLFRNRNCLESARRLSSTRRRYKEAAKRNDEHAAIRQLGRTNAWRQNSSRNKTWFTVVWGVLIFQGLHARGQQQQLPRQSLEFGTAAKCSLNHWNVKLIDKSWFAKCWKCGTSLPWISDTYYLIQSQSNVYSKSKELQMPCVLVSQNLGGSGKRHQRATQIKDIMTARSTKYGKVPLMAKDHSERREWQDDEDASAQKQSMTAFPQDAGEALQAHLV